MSKEDLPDDILEIALTKPPICYILKSLDGLSAQHSKANDLYAAPSRFTSQIPAAVSYNFSTIGPKALTVTSIHLDLASRMLSSEPIGWTRMRGKWYSQLAVKTPRGRMKPSDPVTPPRTFTAFINRCLMTAARSDRKLRHLIADNRRWGCDRDFCL